MLPFSLLFHTAPPMIKPIAAALPTLTHGWSPRLLSFLLNDPHCSPCLVLFSNHIANGNLPASSLPAFRVRKVWDFGMVMSPVGSFGLSHGAQPSLCHSCCCLPVIRSQWRQPSYRLATQAVISCPGAPSPVVISIEAQTFFNSRSRDIMLDRAYSNEKLSPYYPFINMQYGPGAVTYVVYFDRDGVSPIFCLSHDDGCNQGGTLSMLMECNSVDDQTQSYCGHSVCCCSVRR
eukprot:g42099.t1